MKKIIKFVGVVLLGAVLLGALILGWARPVPEKVKEVEVTREVTKVVEKEKVVTVVVERTVVVQATPVVPATPTQTATPVPTSTATVMGSVSLPVTATGQITATTVVFTGTLPMTLTVNGWDVTLYQGVTNQIVDWARTLTVPMTDWVKFPNEDFPKYGFHAKDGLEYGMAESAYCQQSQKCDVNVPAMHYRLVTGDYLISQIGECGGENIGCAIALFNIGKRTAMFRDSSVDYGFTVDGRYWNGDALPEAILALSSNTVTNMLNTAVSSSTVNPGANCNSPNGCDKVRFTLVIVDGNKLLMRATIDH